MNLALPIPMLATCAVAIHAVSALLFGAAAWMKASSIHSFATTIRAIVPVTRDGALRLSGTIVAGEGAAAVLLAFGATGGICLAIALLCVFAFIAAYAKVRGLELRCNCFGNSQAPLGYRIIVRNLLWSAALAASAFIADPGAASLTGSMTALLGAGYLLSKTYRLVSQ